MMTPHTVVYNLHGNPTPGRGMLGKVLARLFLTLLRGLVSLKSAFVSTARISATMSKSLLRYNQAAMSGLGHSRSSVFLCVVYFVRFGWWSQRVDATLRASWQ
jgi:hypothetical protein